MLHGLAIISLTLYVAALIWLLLSAASLVSSNKARVAKVFFILAFVLQTLSIAAIYLSHEKQLPTTAGDYYLWLSWVLAFIGLVTPKIFRIPQLLVVVVGVIVTLFVSSSYLIHFSYSLDGVYKNDESELSSLALFILHILPAFVGEIALLIAFASSLIFLITAKKLKDKNVALNSVASLPNLSSLDNISRCAVLVGFLALGLSIASGTVFAFLRHQALLINDPVRIIAFLTWLALAIILHSRIQLLASSRQIALSTTITVAVFSISLLIYLIASGGDFHSAT
jgi:ABC-type transport system involved in cytochrome c biogenesis permease subunit